MPIMTSGAKGIPQIKSRISQERAGFEMEN